MQALLARQRGLLMCHFHQQQQQTPSRCPTPSRRTATTTAIAATTTPATPAPPTPRHGELITSPSNRYVRHCVRLRDSPRHRWEHGSVLLVGATLLTELAAAAQQQGGSGGSGSSSPAGLANARVLFVPAEDEDEEQGGNAGADSSSSSSSLAALVQQHQQQNGKPADNTTPNRRPAAAAVVRASLAVLRSLAGVPTAGEGADAEGRLAAAVVDIPRDLVAYVNNAATATAAAEQASRVLLPGDNNNANNNNPPPASPPPSSPSSPSPRQPLRPLRLLALDGVQDPGNLGTLLRTAAAFGWRGAWLLPGCADAYGAKAVRAARGVQLRWPVVTGPGAGWDALEAFAHEQGARLVAAALPGQVGGGGRNGDKQQNSGGNVILVLGAEGQGLSAEALRRCDASLSVPMADGAMESLNVAVAGGVLMFALGDGGGGGAGGGKRRGRPSASASASASNPAVKTLLRDVDALF